MRLPYVVTNLRHVCVYAIISYTLNQYSKGKINMTKKQVAIRISDIGESILEEYSKKLGITRTSVIELSLREFKKLQDKDNEQKNNN